MSQSRELIIIVDDNLANLQAGKDTLSDRYRVLTIASAEKMFEMLGRFSPGLILLDVDMPGMNGHEAIKVLKGRPETRDIPVIFLTGMTDPVSEATGLALGAADYVAKPFSPPLLSRRVEIHLRLESQRRKLMGLGCLVGGLDGTIARRRDKLILALSELIGERGRAAGNRVERTLKCLEILLKGVKEAGQGWTGAEDWDAGLVLRSGQLYDLGKIGIGDQIINKPGKLTEMEFEAVKGHVALSVAFIDRVDDGDAEEEYLRLARIMAAGHHERWDGSGYPQGLSGKGIPFLGRLMAIADTYGALTSESPHRDPYSHGEAVCLVQAGAGTHFDPELVRLFGTVADGLRESVQQGSPGNVDES
jgi:putative two-component system response regulator